MSRLEKLRMPSKKSSKPEPEMEFGEMSEMSEESPAEESGEEFTGEEEILTEDSAAPATDLSMASDEELLAEIKKRKLSPGSKPEMSTEETEEDFSQEQYS